MFVFPGAERDRESAAFFRTGTYRPQAATIKNDGLRV